MRNEKFYEKLRAAGHVLKRDEFEPGKVDNFALDYGYNNGPVCVTCGDSWCEHCEDHIDPCSKPAIDAEFININNKKKLT